jgi:hypothetical protein
VGDDRQQLVGEEVGDDRAESEVRDRPEEPLAQLLEVLPEGHRPVLGRSVLQQIVTFAHEVDVLTTRGAAVTVRGGGAATPIAP